jgi:ribosomal protein S18 acetylase RimI-like enzyme
VTTTGVDDPVLDNPVLDNPVWAALTGPHKHFAEISGQAVRYPVDVCPFLALSAEAGPQAWADVRALVGPGGHVGLAGPHLVPPGEWDVVRRLDGVQMTGHDVVGADEPEAEVLGARDVPELLDLVARTKPGPLRARTIEMGRYIGIRRGGALVAMAGERLRPPGWTEVSGVCTDRAYQGQGLAGRLVRAVAAGIRARGETPFLHAAADNTSAIRLYRALGFRLRRKVEFTVVRAPE